MKYLYQIIAYTTNLIIPKTVSVRLKWMYLISYFACIFMRFTQLLTSNAVTSLVVFGWRKAQLRDLQRLCVEQLGESNLPRVVGTKPPPKNKLGTCCLHCAVTSFLSSFPIIPYHRGIVLRCDNVITTPRWALIDEHMWNLVSASKQYLSINCVCMSGVTLWLFKDHTNMFST